MTMTNPLVLTILYTIGISFTAFASIFLFVTWLANRDGSYDKYIYNADIVLSIGIAALILSIPLERKSKSAHTTDLSK